MRISELISIIKRVAPLDLAYDWDNPGLQVGSYAQDVGRIGLALDATEATVEEAVNAGCDLLFTHHPLIFKPIRNINVDSYPGSVIARAASLGMAIYAAHTNWDSAARGVAQALADRLELGERRPLEPAMRDFLKLAVFVPTGYEKKVREALFAVGAGVVGAYDRCWFGAPGEGGFRPPEDGNPFIGAVGRETRTRESRIEVILPAALADRAAGALFESHPYEEPAFEFYPIKIQSRDMGLGLVGRWSRPRDLLDELKRIGCPNFKWAGPKPDRVETVALLPGSGGGYLHQAAGAGAQVLITGDAGYHQALEAESLRLTLVDLGHYETEWPGVEQLGRVLREEFDLLGLDVECLVLKQNCSWRYCCG